METGVVYSNSRPAPPTVSLDQQFGLKALGRVVRSSAAEPKKYTANGDSRCASALPSGAHAIRTSRMVRFMSVSFLPGEFLFEAVEESLGLFQRRHVH